MWHTFFPLELFNQILISVCIFIQQQGRVTFQTVLSDDKDKTDVYSYTSDKAWTGGWGGAVNKGICR